MDQVVLPQTIWLIVFLILVPYEAWGIWKGYKFTLTAGMRAWLKRWPWLKVPLTALLLWLIYHFVVEAP